MVGPYSANGAACREACARFLGSDPSYTRARTSAATGAWRESERVSALAYRLLGPNSADQELRMPTLLPPRVPESKQRDEFSPALILTIAVLALFMVMAEARALGGWDWTSSLPPSIDMILPM